MEGDKAESGEINKCIEIFYTKLGKKGMRAQYYDVPYYKSRVGNLRNFTKQNRLHEEDRL